MTKVLKLLAFICATAHALDDRCPWLFSNFASKKMIRDTDPSDQKAIEDVLRGIFQKPSEPLSADAKVWVEEYKLHAVVDEVRAEGKKVEAELKKQTRGRAAAIAAGSAVFITAAAVKALRQINRQLDYEGEINRAYGLNLEGNTHEELDFIKSTLECRPGDDKLPKDQLSKYKKFRKVRELATALVFESTVFEETGKIDEMLTEWEYQNLFNVWWDPLESTCRHASLSIL